MEALAPLLIVAALALLTAAFRRWPTTLPLGLLAALPFRVPVEVGGATYNLLGPLYLTIAAGLIAHTIQARQGQKSPPSPRSDQPTHRPTIQYLLAATVALYALQATYSSDIENALKQFVFFFAPFALMGYLLLRSKWDARALRIAFAILLVEAIAFSLVGLLEYQTRHLLWNPKVIASNQFESYFRVNSVFWDPNIYGRYLVVAILAATAAMLWAKKARQALTLAAICAVLWGGLVLSFSQSSFAALLVGLAVLAALRWSARWTAGVSAIAVTAATILVVAFGDTVKVDLGSRKSLDKATSGRVNLIEGGANLALDRPLTGHGSGAFSRAYRRAQKSGSKEAVTASHTEPVTIAAEQGLPGLLLYLALIATAALTLLRGPLTLPRAAIATAFTAIVFHSMAYAAFLTDPMTWALLAIGTSLAGARGEGPGCPVTGALTKGKPLPTDSHSHPRRLRKRGSRPLPPTTP